MNKIILPNIEDMPCEKQGLFAWMYFFMRPYRLPLFATLFLRGTRHTVFALLIYFFSKLIDALQSGYAFENPKVIWTHVIVISVVYLFAMSSYRLQVYESYAVDKMGRSLRIFGMKHLMSLTLDWHESQGSGAKLQRVIQAMENLQNLYFVFARSIMPFIGELIGILLAVITLDVPKIFFLFYILYIVTYLAITWYLQKPIGALWRNYNIWKEELISRIYDFISLIRMTKSFSLDHYVSRRSKEKELEGHFMVKKIRRLAMTKWAVSSVSVWFWMLVIIVVGLQEVLDKNITIGAFSALIFMGQRLWTFLETMATVQMDYVEYKAGFLRIRGTLRTPVQNFDTAPIVKTPKNWQKIECISMASSYNPDRLVLRNINLAIPRGKHIALIGSSGAGKSTLVKLLMKQIVPVSGDIIVGDASLKNIASDDWLSHLALVPQDVELMNATLRENILLDRDDVDEEFYRECLRKAYLEEFIATLPQGDETEIGERGVKLSGGQKQRLGIARALARNADVIILDEATSSLDSESEAFIQKAMETAFTDKTVIVIAHRLSTIKHADIIYVFDKGVVAESGDFATLEKKGGIFSRLWQMQSNGFIPN